ncbi:hypothetical protein J6590_107100, partial [Homalodisca vitripennis]
QSRLSPRISRHFRNTKKILILILTTPPRHMTHYLVHDFSSVSSLPTYLATLPEYQKDSYSNIDNPTPSHDALPGARLQLSLVSPHLSLVSPASRHFRSVSSLPTYLAIPEYQDSYSNIDNPTPSHDALPGARLQLSLVSPTYLATLPEYQKILILILTIHPSHDALPGARLQLSLVSPHVSRDTSGIPKDSYSNIDNPTPSHDALPGATSAQSRLSPRISRHFRNTKKILILILTTPPRHMTHYLVHDFSSVSSLPTYLATLPEYQKDSYSNIDNPTPSHDALPGARLQLSLVSPHVSSDTPGIPNSSPRISRYFRNTKQVVILILKPPPRHMTHYLVHDFSCKNLFCIAGVSRDTWGETRLS